MSERLTPLTLHYWSAVRHEHWIQIEIVFKTLETNSMLTQLIAWEDFITEKFWLVLYKTDSAEVSFSYSDLLLLLTFIFVYVCLCVCVCAWYSLCNPLGCSEDTS
jgi:hypothetical protein